MPVFTVGPRKYLKVNYVFSFFVWVCSSVYQDYTQSLKNTETTESCQFFNMGLKIKAIKSWCSPSWEQKQDLRTLIESKYAI